MKKYSYALYIISIAVALVFSGCPATPGEQTDDGDSGSTDEPNRVALPVFDPPDAGPYYMNFFNAAISCETSGATIRYTVDGSDPSQTNGTEGNTVGISLYDNDCTLKAIAYKQDMENSTVASITYIHAQSQSTDFKLYNDTASTTLVKFYIKIGENWSCDQLTTWHLSAGHYLTYDRIPPGSYDLRVENGDGSFTKSVTGIPILNGATVSWHVKD
jgi:hypothetical protein